MQLKYCDKQIVNELVYRWCRILTRQPKSTQTQTPSNTFVQDVRKVLIIDLIGAFSAIRLGSILKKDEKRLRMISIARGCKINSTYVTISSFLGQQANIPSSLKLVVVYHDEFFILKTLEILKHCLDTTKCQILLVVPRLDRREQDVLNLTSNNQMLRCDFCVNRQEMGRVQQKVGEESNQSLLNQVYFKRFSHDKSLPERVAGELMEDGMHFDLTDLPTNNPKRMKKI